MTTAAAADDDDVSHPVLCPLSLVFSSVPPSDRRGNNVEVSPTRVCHVYDRRFM